MLLLDCYRVSWGQKAAKIAVTITIKFADGLAADAHDRETQIPTVYLNVELITVKWRPFLAASLSDFLRGVGPGPAMFFSQLGVPSSSFS
jgi:hypothetical protein